MADVTRILSDAGQGDFGARERLLPLVYDELRRLAAQKLGRESAGHTLQPTALVHEAWLRLVDQRVPQAWNSRGHFYSAAAEAMRRILVEAARRRSRIKRGGGLRRVSLTDVDPGTTLPSDQLLELDEAMSRFAVEEPLKARLVELRFFGGLSVEDAASALGISEVSAKRYWRYARAWLHREISESRPK